MADEDRLLCELAKLAQSEKSWIEVKDILEELKTWAVAKRNR